MKPIDEESLSKLLRLKRYEQPPPGYFESFLEEFHRRQRAEMLRRPAWRLFLERLATYWETRFAPLLPEWTGSQIAYGAASAAVLAIAGVFTFHMLQHPGEGMNFAMENRNPGERNEAAAQQPVTSSIPVQVASATVSSRPVPTERLTLNNVTLGLPEATVIQERLPTATSRHYPRYVIDARPASYEPPFSF